MKRQGPVYFNVLIEQYKDLSIELPHGGDKVGFPVNTSGAPTAHTP